MTNEIQSGLEADSRRSVEQVPDFSDAAAVEAFLSRFRQFAEGIGLSQAQIAARTGYSTGTISQVLAGRYGGDASAVIVKLVGLMNETRRKNSRADGDVFISTTIAQKIKSLITQTVAFGDEEGRIGLIIGDGGHGKSACLREYATASGNAVYVQWADGLPLSAVFETIAKQFKVSVGRSVSGLIAQLAEAMAKRQWAILIDEASSLTARQLDRLRQVVVVKGKSPLILAGNNDLLATIRHDSSRRGYASLDQFNSRLISVLNLDEIASIDGGGGLYSTDDIRRLFEYGGIKLHGEAVDTLRRIAKTPKSGRLRTCKIIVSALHLAQVVRVSGLITGDLIRDAIYQLGLPVKDYLPMIFMESKQNRRASRAAIA